MSFDSANRFAFLDADGDGFVAPPPAPVKVVEKEAAAPAKKADAPRPAGRGDGGDRGRGRGRGGERGRGRGGDRPARPRQDGDRAPRGADPPSEEQRDERRTGRFEGEGRPARAPGSMDRHSRGGPGSNREEKRSGGGRFNWGKDGDSKEEAAATSSADELAPAEAGAEGAEKAEAVPVVEKTAEELAEERQMTMEQYKKKLEEDRAKLTALDLKPRAAGEGEDDSQWKNTTVLKKEVEEDSLDALFAGTKKDKKAVHKKEATKQDVSKDLLRIRYEDESASIGGRGRGRGGRGGRGGESSGRGRGSDRPRTQGQGSISLNDANQFPSLG